MVASKLKQYLALIFIMDSLEKNNNKKKTKMMCAEQMRVCCSALLLVFDMTVVVGEATLQDYASNLLTLPDFHLR